MLNKSYSYTFRNNDTKEIYGFVSLMGSPISRSVKPLYHAAYAFVKPEMHNNKCGREMIVFLLSMGKLKGYYGKIVLTFIM